MEALDIMKNNRGKKWTKVLVSNISQYTFLQGPGDDMKDELRTDGDPIAWLGVLHRTSYGSYGSQLHP